MSNFYGIKSLSFLTVIYKVSPESHEYNLAKVGKEESTPFIKIIIIKKNTEQRFMGIKQK